MPLARSFRRSYWRALRLGNTTRSTAEGTSDKGATSRLLRDVVIARKGLRLLVIPAVAVLVVFLLPRMLGRFDAADVLASIQAIPTYHIVLSGLFAAASYTCLTMFDLLGVRYVERDVPYRSVALISFASLAIGHNIGFAALSSGAIRYRFYTLRGLLASEVVLVILFCGVTVGLGLSSLGGLALCVRPELSAKICHITPSLAAGAGAACLLMPMAYFLLCTVMRRPIAFRSRLFKLPPPTIALRQLIVGPLNFALVAACLHQALAGVSDAAYSSVVTVYVLANVATLVSHVPGGLGVIEGLVVLLIPAPGIVGALIVFRLIYFLIPLVLGSAVLIALEFASARRSRRRQS